MVECNRPSQEADGYKVYPNGDVVLAVFPCGGYGVFKGHLAALHFLQTLEFLSEKGEVENVGKDDACHGLPTKVEEHVAETEIPLGRNHHDGRCGKVGERATYRDVDEQQGQCGVAEALAGLQLVNLLAEQNGSQCHGGGLSDE